MALPDLLSNLLKCLDMVSVFAVYPVLIQDLHTTACVLVQHANDKYVAGLLKTKQHNVLLQILNSFVSNLQTTPNNWRYSMAEQLLFGNILWLPCKYQLQSLGIVLPEDVLCCRYLLILRAPGPDRYTELSSSQHL